MDPSPRAFCVGQAKSGTASLYGLLAARYRAAHEPERAALLDMILRESTGEVSSESMRAFLEERQHRLRLEYDIAWANQFVAPHLLEVFPRTLFIALVREPYGWLESTVGHLLSRQIPPEVRGFLDWWFRPEEYPCSSHDQRLQARGLYSVDAFLMAWRRHVRLCLDVIPEERRLVIRTRELPSSHERLATFLGIPPDSLDAGQGHLNKGSWDGKLDQLVDPAYVRDRIASVCASEVEEV